MRRVPGPVVNNPSWTLRLQYAITPFVVMFRAGMNIVRQCDTVEVIPDRYGNRTQYATEPWRPQIVGDYGYARRETEEIDD